MEWLRVNGRNVKGLVDLAPAGMCRNGLGDGAKGRDSPQGNSMFR